MAYPALLDRPRRQARASVSKPAITADRSEEDSLERAACNRCDSSTDVRRTASTPFSGQQNPDVAKIAAIARRLLEIAEGLELRHGF
jgi:hypothetical protein